MFLIWFVHSHRIPFLSKIKQYIHRRLSCASINYIIQLFSQKFYQIKYLNLVFNLATFYDRFFLFYVCKINLKHIFSAVKSIVSVETSTLSVYELTKMAFCRQNMSTCSFVNNSYNSTLQTIHGFNRRFIGVMSGTRVWKFKMHAICKISDVKKFKLVHCLRFIHRGSSLCRTLACIL